MDVRCVTQPTANNRHWCVNVAGATVLCQTGDHISPNCSKCLSEKCFDLMLVMELPSMLDIQCGMLLWKLE